MPVATIVDERRLQRGLDPRHLGQIDISGKLPLVQVFEIKFFDLVSVCHHDPGLFRVGGVDQHFLRHSAFHDNGPSPRGGHDRHVLLMGRLQAHRRRGGCAASRPSLSCPASSPVYSDPRAPISGGQVYSMPDVVGTGVSPKAAFARFRKLTPMREPMIGPMIARERISPVPTTDQPAAQPYVLCVT